MRAAKLVLTLALVCSGLATTAPAAAAPNGYVEMSDGIKIAVNVRIPAGCSDAAPCPAIFEMSGYDGGSATGYTLSGEYLGHDAPLARDSRQLTEMFDDSYATIHASVRGTGCSAGEFDLFSWRSALDGYELVEWIADQPWSNGDVGIIGHSYGGITGFMVAATQPPSLRTMAVSGLIDDIYRGIVYLGGVSNYGFPLLWTGGIRNLYDVGGGTMPGLVRPGDREQCARNLSTHSRTVLNDPIIQGAADTDNTWYQARSLANYAHLVDVPIHITGAYQDEQTGPRGPSRLWEMVAGVPKRLILTNGDHGTAGPYRGLVKAERRAWMDHWMRGVDAGFGDPDAEETHVTVMLETRGGVANGIKHATTFPLEDTQWTDYYLRESGALRVEFPGDEPGDAYVSGSPRQSWSYETGPRIGSPVTTVQGPDELTYRSDAVGASPVAIAGPVTATLWVKSTAVDTELFVQLVDEAPDGSRTYLQRGMLKASHRAIDHAHSDYTGGVLYRPHRPHTNPTLITPDTSYEYLVEVFPVGHVFRPGHRIVVKIHTPPASDSLYAYVPKRPAGINTVLHDSYHASRLRLPVVPLTGVTLGAELPCGSQEAVRCVP